MLFSLLKCFHNRNGNRKMHMFFSTIGDDGSRQYCSEAAILSRVFWFSHCFLSVRKIFNGFCRAVAFPLFFISKWFTSCFITAAVIFNIFFSTIGDDGSRQYCSDAAILAAVLRFSLPKWRLLDFFHIKRNGFCTLYQNEDSFQWCIVFGKGPIYIRKPHVFLSQGGDIARSK